MRRITTALAALTAMGMTVPAMAQNLYYDGAAGAVDIDVEVEEIAYLNVVNGTGSMVIDDDQDSFMGNPSSDGSVTDAVGGTLATIQLLTNFNIDAIRVNFDRVTGLRNFGTSAFFGEAIGVNSGNTLGVWPQIGSVDPATGTTSGQRLTSHDGSNTPLEITGAFHAGTQSGFAAGTHDFALGVSTNWDRTLPGEPEFAEPDTYQIQLTATIVPTL